MKTELLKADENGLKTAADLIKKGETVVFPTETVYGLGADALNKAAVEKIFKAKGRPSDNPLIVHIAEKEALSKIVKEVPAAAKLLMEKFWPGPLTIIMEKTDNIPYEVTAGLDTVGVRMPENKEAREFLRLSECPVAAPSANISGRPSPTNFGDVCYDMNEKVSAIIEGEPSKVGVESTVIDMTLDIPVVLRPGGVTVEEIEAVIGKVLVSGGLKESTTPKAPGMKYKHYAPKAKVYIIKGSSQDLKKFLIEKKGFLGRAGVLCFDEFIDDIKPHAVALSLGSMKSAADAAKNLFTLLRKMDELGVDIIFAPEITEEGLWLAVKNRLYKAASGNIIDVPRAICMLFVCSGNTCRSPMAEGIFALHTRYNNVICRSAGLFAAEGNQANEKAVISAKKLGADISGHISKPITLEMINAADYTVVMTKDMKNALSSYRNVVLFSSLAGENGDIPDPYGSTQEVYDECAKEIKRLSEKAVL